MNAVALTVRNVSRTIALYSEGYAQPSDDRTAGSQTFGRREGRKGSQIHFAFEGASPKARTRLRRNGMTRTLTVEGMSCDHCEQTVEEALEGVEGVDDATADRDAERATVEGDAATDDLVAAVEDVGYQASA